MDRLLILKSALLKAYGGLNPGSRIADDCGISRQAVNKWPRYVPELQVRRLIEKKPELRALVKVAGPKRRRRRRVVEVISAQTL